MRCPPRVAYTKPLIWRRDRPMKCPPREAYSLPVIWRIWRRRRCDRPMRCPPREAYTKPLIWRCYRLMRWPPREAYSLPVIWKTWRRPERTLRSLCRWSPCFCSSAHQMSAWASYWKSRQASYPLRPANPAPSGSRPHWLKTRTVESVLNHSDIIAQ